MSKIRAVALRDGIQERKSSENWRSIEDKMLENIKDLISRSWASGPLALKVDSRRERLESDMYNLLSAARDRALTGGKWKPTKETLAAEGELLDLFTQVVLGYATLADFTAACSRWETAGSKK